MGKPIRMFQIIEHLRAARRGLTGGKLAERLGVSLRTIYRDIAALQAMGVPIDGAAGVGYLIRPGFSLPPLHFTADEAEAIAVALALLPRTGDAGLLAAAERVADKLARASPASGAPTLNASGWHDIPAGIDAAALRRAIRECRVVALSYRAKDGTETRREILPLALTYFVESQVLAAWCRLRGDIRHFRLDRITACRTTGEGFAAEAPRLRRLVSGQQR